jgi:hypothetical protein
MNRATLMGPGVGLLLLLAASTFALGAKVEIWRQESPSAFAKAKKERVVVSDSGRVRLGRAVAATEGIDATHVWDLARVADVVYAATGNAGKVFRREAQGRWTLAYDAEDSQALSLASLPDGRVFLGTGPSGQVIEISDPKHPASRPDKEVLYIWDLTADRAGNLYAATGPTGQLWKRSTEGTWSLLLDSKHPHLLCVAVDAEGSVYAGSDSEGLIYRVKPDGKVSVVYDAAQSEVRTLLVGPDGSLFAGTAAEAGGGGAAGGATRGFNPSFSANGPTPSAPGRTDQAVAATAFTPVQGPGRPAESAGGTASPRPALPGENAVYRIGSDGSAREIFRAKALIFALAWEGDRILIGTGPEGQLYEVRGAGRESSSIVRVDHSQILALLTNPGGALLIGTGDPGGVLRLSPDHFVSGTLISEVHDTKLVSRFGALSWKAETPRGSSLALQVRTGMVGEPDATWSPWSASQTDPGASQAGVPPGRFVQYRAILKTDEPSNTPELRSVQLAYQTVNLPPEVTKIDVPDLSAGDGATKQAKLNLRWEATDPNGDDLQYTLYLRKDGWPDWIKLTDSPQSEKTYSWDASAVPGGTYRVRISASDRPSNGWDEAITRDLTSEPFVVDHQAPSVSVSIKGTTATVNLKDDLTRLVRAAYALDGGDWMPVFPTDRLFDSPNETISIPLADIQGGTHILMVRATDAAGNIGTGDLVIKLP